jgi:hypothetical protein
MAASVGAAAAVARTQRRADMDRRLLTTTAIGDRF